MAENLFTDNLDLQFQLDHLDLSEVVESLEDGYSAHAQYPAAPRNYADAKDNYRLLLNLLGEVCATRIAPRAAEADEEGAHFCDGRVTYAAATQEALEVLCQADLMGAVLSWEYGGLNLPETIFQMMVEIISRADAGLDRAADPPRGSPAHGCRCPAGPASFDPAGGHLCPGL